MTIPFEPAHIFSFCVDCNGNLFPDHNDMVCHSCERRYQSSKEGVWDFRKTKEDNVPSIYKQPEFVRWLKIFREQESKNWYIYKNKFFRYFSQSGHRLMAKLLSDKHAARVLELGAGTGTLLEHVTLAHYVGVDTSYEALTLLKEKHPQAIAVCVSSERLPFADSVFSEVISIHVLEHLYYLSESLDEISRVLIDAGRNLFVIPTEGGVMFKLGRKFFTGPHLKKQYDLDVDYVMDREHINDANRVIKFLRMHFKGLVYRYWPLGLIGMLSFNSMIIGCCDNDKKVN